MRFHLVAMLLVAAVSPSRGAEPSIPPDQAQPGGSAGEARQNEDDHDKAAAAAILTARQKAVDDIRAGRPAPYYFAFPPATPPPRAQSAPRSAD